LAILLAVLVLFTATPLAGATLELREGENAYITVINPENQTATISLVNINWPSGTPPLYYYPAQVPENSTINVLVHFMYFSQNVEDGKYAVKLSWGSGETLIYLVVENSEHSASVRQKVDNLENKVAAILFQINSLSSYLENIDNASQRNENSIAGIAMLVDNLKEELLLVSADLDNLDNRTNGIEVVKGRLEAAYTQLSTISDRLAQLASEDRTIKDSLNQLYAISIIFAALVVGVILQTSGVLGRIGSRKEKKLWWSKAVVKPGVKAERVSPGQKRKEEEPETPPEGEKSGQ